MFSKKASLKYRHSAHFSVKTGRRERKCVRVLHEILNFRQDYNSRYQFASSSVKFVRDFTKYSVGIANLTIKNTQRRNSNTEVKLYAIL